MSSIYLSFKESTFGLWPSNTGMPSLERFSIRHPTSRRLYLPKPFSQPQTKRPFLFKCSKNKKKESYSKSSRLPIAPIGHLTNSKLSSCQKPPSSSSNSDQTERTR